MVELKKNEQELTAEIMGKVNLSKDKEKLEGKVVNLSKCIVNLSKKSNVDIGSTKAQVVFVMDRSGSMSGEYSDGTVQQIITTLLPVGLTFDDNGTVEVYQFNHSVDKLDDLNISNYETYVKKCMKGASGTTKYSGPLKEILKDYFGVNVEGSKVSYEKPKKKGLFGRLFGKKTVEESVQTSGSMADTSEFPVFVLYITDGDIDYDDEDTMNALVRESSKLNCFIQFIGASSSSSFSYLTKLDNLDGRVCDNTGFVKFSDIHNISDTDMYNAVLEQYAEWLKVRGF